MRSGTNVLTYAKVANDRDDAGLMSQDGKQAEVIAGLEAPRTARAATRITTLQIGMTASVSRAGGVDRYFFNLMDAIGNNGVGSRGLVAGHPAAVESLPNVSTYAAERASLPLKWLGLRRHALPLLDESDVVVSHFAPYAFPILDQVQGRPFVVHFHGPWAMESEAEGSSGIAVEVKRKIERAVYKAASRVITLSSAFADIVINNYGIPADRVRVIPGGVDLARFDISTTRAEARARLGWPVDRPTVLTVRRLVHSKGVDNLIRAAVAIRERVPNVFIAIVGTGPLAESLQAQIDELGLGDTVRMIGQVSEEDLPSVYRAADLLVVPTITLEGFGLVVVEALASGTPALVTPIGGLPNVVRPLESSLVLESYEPEAIAKGISAALLGESRVPDETECVAYAQRFCWSHIASQVADVYREAIFAGASQPSVQRANGVRARAHRQAF